jgi:hypothetical protein
METIEFLTKNNWRIIHCHISIRASAAIRHVSLFFWHPHMTHDGNVRPTSKTKNSLVLLDIPPKEGCSDSTVTGNLHYASACHRRQMFSTGIAQRHAATVPR